MTTGPAHPRTSHLLRGMPLLVCAVLVCVMLVVSACSGGSDASDKKSASPSPSSSASPSSSSTSASPTAKREAPAVEPKAKRGKAGQKAFARYVMRLWGYGLRNNDAKPLVSLSPKKKPCRGCKDYARSLQQRRKRGWTVDFPGVTVHKLTTAKVQGDTYVKAVVDIPASNTYNRDGSFRNTNKAHNGAAFEMLLHFEKLGYQLLAFTVS
jgi:hypothetical protein